MDTVTETAPGPLPRPPDRPPAERIIIRTPPRPPDAPEVDTPGDADDEEPEAEIRRPPPWAPDRPPPAPPEERATRR